MVTNLVLYRKYRPVAYAPSKPSVLNNFSFESETLRVEDQHGRIPNPPDPSCAVSIFYNI